MRVAEFERNCEKQKKAKNQLLAEQEQKDQ